MNEPVVAGHRIVTLTMNPALDITTSTDVVHSTDKLRCNAARYDPGGGGINVAHVADVLGAWATDIYPAGGAAGDNITKLLIAEGVSGSSGAHRRGDAESITVNERSTGEQYRFVLAPGIHPGRADRMPAALRKAASRRPSWWPAAACRRGAWTSTSRSPTSARRSVRCSSWTGSGGGLKHITSGCSCSNPACANYANSWAGNCSPTEQIAAARELIGRGCAAHRGLPSARRARCWSPRTARTASAVPVPNGSGVGPATPWWPASSSGLTRGWPRPNPSRQRRGRKTAHPGTAPCTRDDTERLFEQTVNPIDIDLVNS